MNYDDFLSRRRATPPQVGFQVAESDLHPSLFPFQRRATALSLQRGRAALFEDTGLGKSRQILEWKRLVADYTGRRCLLLTPLAVAHQFVRDEAPALGLSLAYCRSQAEADASSCRLIVTNYEMADRFDPAQFAGVALDEADIISNYVGATNRLLCRLFAETPYRLVATATPAPNDLIELGRYSEFLGIMESGEMLTRYFIRDSQQAATLRLRHWAAAGPFWDWLTSWAICMGLPSDLSDEYSDDGYVLPALQIEQHTVAVDYKHAQDKGQLFPNGKRSATDLWATKHETLEGRVAKTAEIVSAFPNEPWLIWCSTDDEQRVLARAFGERAISVYGSLSAQQKEQRIVAWLHGDRNIFISKPSICGQGLNFQHCAHMVFCSPTFSFRDFYQGLRRIYRFRQQRAVTCHVVIAETEESVIAAVERKQAQHRELHTQARAAMRRQHELADDWRISVGEARPLVVPHWLRAA